MQRTKYKDVLEFVKATNINVSNRVVEFKGGEISILYIKELTDRAMLSEEVIKPLIKNNTEINLLPDKVYKTIIFSDSCMREEDNKKIIQYLLDGMTILVFSNTNKYLVVDLKKVMQRSIPTPNLTYTLRGPQDCFIENLEANLSLLRYRLKDKNLKIDILEVGARTKTKVAVAYIEDITKDKYVEEIEKRINKINTDGIIESGELQAFLLNKKKNLFPQMGIVERSDMACGALLEGKVITLVEGSGVGLIAPKVLQEFLWTCEDFYDNKYLTSFLHIIRVSALILSFTVSAIYVAVVSFHNDVLPSDYIIAIAQARSKVPFNALVEVLLIEFIVELLREALIRVPNKIGTAVGIVGAIIIGEAAISAGIFSPLLLIVVSISLISVFVVPDFTLTNPFRIIKFLLIIITGLFGFYGFILGITLMVANLVSVNTFGVAYMAPFAPFNMKDFLKGVFYSKSMAPKRPNYLNLKDKTRGKTPGNNQDPKSV
jgi:spore germination protein KA/spore germination protein